MILIDEDDTIQHTLIGSVSAHVKFQQHLLGETITKGVVLVDPEDGKAKIYFIFNDYHIKTPGDYRFLCYLLDFNCSQILSNCLKTDLFQIQRLNGYKKENYTSTLVESFKIQGYEFHTKICK